MTFTNSARLELERKLGEKNPLKDNIVISTLNKLGADLLKSHTEKKHHDSPIYTDGSDIEKRNKWYYVAMTRAKKSLTLTVPKEYAGISVSTSPYIVESGLNMYL